MQGGAGGQRREGEGGADSFDGPGHTYREWRGVNAVCAAREGDGGSEGRKRLTLSEFVQTVGEMRPDGAKAVYRKMEQKKYILA